MRQLVATLPPRYRDAIVLYCFQELGKPSNTHYKA